MGIFTFFHGDLLSAIFSKDAQVIAASHDYLKAYAVDCLLTPFLFCFMGYYNGCEKTLFVMLQGLIGAFGVRIPVVYLVSRLEDPSLFQIGLADAGIQCGADCAVCGDVCLDGTGIEAESTV